MNQSRLIIPTMPPNPMIMRNTYMMPRNISLIQRISGNLKAFNWTKLLSGANKTLNVMNQTIPLIRQTKPMINNVKNIIKLTKAFKSETNSNSNNTIIINKHDDITSNEYPTFFI